MKNIILSIVLFFSFSGCTSTELMLSLSPVAVVVAPSLEVAVVAVVATVYTIKKTEKALATRAKPKEILKKNRVLVYDKAISFPISSVSYLQFSPTNSNELAITSGAGYTLIDLKNGSLKKEMKFNESEDSYLEDSYLREFNYSDDGKNTSIRAISLDKQYILLQDSIIHDKKVKDSNSKEISLEKKYILFQESQKIENSNYRVYDLKNKKTIHNLGDLFPNNKHYEYLFLSNNKIAFKYLSENSLAYLSAKPLLKENWYISVIDLTTKEKKSVEIPNNMSWIPLNSRYILGKNVIENQGLINIFDTKEMKIIQQFTYSTEYNYPHIAISQKYKKLAFAHGNRIFIYNIVEKKE